MTLALGLVEVQKLRARVEDGAVLQVVDLARLEPHLDVEGRVLGDLVDQVEELGLLRREPRHRGVALRLADVPGDVEEGEVLT